MGRSLNCSAFQKQSFSTAMSLTLAWPRHSLDSAISSFEQRVAHAYWNVTGLRATSPNRPLGFTTGQQTTWFLPVFGSLHERALTLRLRVSPPKKWLINCARATCTHKTTKRLKFKVKQGIVLAETVATVASGLNIKQSMSPNVYFMLC